jgi:hypothetical protein
MKSWQALLIFVRGEDFINDDIGQTENCWNILQYHVQMDEKRDMIIRFLQ